jgi:hypothetical protein
MGVVPIGPDTQNAATLHRFEAVLDRIVKNLLHLVAIEFQPRQIRAQLGFDDNVAILDFRPEKTHRFLHDRVNVLRLKMRFRRTNRAEKLGHDRIEPVDLGPGNIDRFLQFVLVLIGFLITIIALTPGARFWFDEHWSLAPTISAIYGHTKNDFTANSSFSQANYDAADQAGLINWDVDTWTIVPGAELAYQWTWKRTTFTLSSTYTFFHTQDFHSSSSVVDINSNSETWENKFDVDVPIGVTLFNRELHVGGYYSWTGYYGDLRNGFQESGLDVNWVNEFHGRVVLDFLGKFWKVKWLGIGASYFWGEDFTGWTVGMDVAFKF